MLNSDEGSLDQGSQLRELFQQRPAALLEPVMHVEVHAPEAGVMQPVGRDDDYSYWQLNDKRVFVKADADLPFKYVNELFQVCREGGASEASIVTSEDKRQEGGL